MIIDTRGAVLTKIYFEIENGIIMGISQVDGFIPSSIDKVLFQKKISKKANVEVVGEDGYYIARIYKLYNDESEYVSGVKAIVVSRSDFSAKSLFIGSGKTPQLAVEPPYIDINESTTTKYIRIFTSDIFNFSVYFETSGDTDSVMDDPETWIIGLLFILAIEIAIIYVYFPNEHKIVSSNVKSSFRSLLYNDINQ